MSTYKPPQDVSIILELIRSAGYKAYVVGGCLRAHVLGGVSNDIDIAVLGSVEDILLINNLLDTQPVHARMSTSYVDLDGYVADWRLHSDINIVLYCVKRFPDVQTLTSDFDLCINAWYLDTDGVIRNHHFKATEPVKTLGSRSYFRELQRVQRFRNEYPHLDWSEVNKVYE